MLLTVGDMEPIPQCRILVCALHANANDVEGYKAKNHGE